MWSNGIQDKSTKTKQRSAATENITFSCSRRMLTWMDTKLLRKKKREMEKSNSTTLTFVSSRSSRGQFFHACDHINAQPTRLPNTSFLLCLSDWITIVLQRTFLGLSAHFKTHLNKSTHRVGYFLTEKSG